ncbi:hypothetical protein C8J57DRAFT_1511287 [Mycena rebaudengoi]|nr:hypothetical protein C8J57DRAFT_1511287 [Mycena rebaudengoi]
MPSKSFVRGKQRLTTALSLFLPSNNGLLDHLPLEIPGTTTSGDELCALDTNLTGPTPQLYAGVEWHSRMECSQGATSYARMLPAMRKRLEPNSKLIFKSAESGSTDHHD